MKQRLNPAVTPAMAIAVAALGISALVGLVFAMWIDHGPAIFRALVEAGLSCF